MARGDIKHLKRLNAPKHWMLSKMDGIWAPRPSQGPHKLRECLPIILILRNKLKYALTGKETKQICMEKLVKVDGKVRTDVNYPVGFMDVVDIPKSNDTFRLIFDAKGKFVLHKIDAAEATYKLCRVRSVATTLKKVPYVVTHDGRTIRYPDPLVKVNDVVKVDIATGKIIDFIKFAAGKVAMITKGRNTGRVGNIVSFERHPGAFDIVTLRDAAGNSFATRQENVFVLGEPGAVAVSLPKGQGVRLSIMEERDLCMKANKKASM
jgi:small subunit ribosomal protein S4e